jgi:hypothetical protein
MQLRKKDAFLVTHMSAGKVCELAQARCWLKLTGTTDKPSQFRMLGQNSGHGFRVQRIFRHSYQPLLLLKVCGHHRVPMIFHTRNGGGHDDCIVIIGCTPCVACHNQRMMMLA